MRVSSVGRESLEKAGSVVSLSSSLERISTGMYDLSDNCSICITEGQVDATRKYE